MSDESATPASAPGDQPKEQSETLAEHEVPTQDWLLQDVVRLINHVEGMSIGITLTAHGSVVTGDLISLKEFFYEYGKLWKHGFREMPELANTFEQQWREVADDSSRGIKETKQSLFNYIHLKNARYFLGSTAIPEPGAMLWRGRISEVSGFSIGSFGRATN